MQLLADERVKLDTSLASIIAGHFRTPPKKKTTYFDTLQLKTLIHHSHDIGDTSQAVFFFFIPVCRCFRSQSETGSNLHWSRCSASTHVQINEPTFIVINENPLKKAAWTRRRKNSSRGCILCDFIHLSPGTTDSQENVTNVNATFPGKCLTNESQREGDSLVNHIRGDELPNSETILK